VTRKNIISGAADCPLRRNLPFDSSTKRGREAILRGRETERTSAQVIASNQSVNKYGLEIHARTGEIAVVMYVNVETPEARRNEIEVYVVGFVVAGNRAFHGEPSIEIPGHRRFPAVGALPRAETVRVDVEIGITTEHLDTRNVLSES